MEHHPIIGKIVREGIFSVHVDSLPQELKKGLMRQAGTILVHKGRNEESAYAFYMAEDNESLNEYCRWFLEQHKPKIAAYFAQYIPKIDLLERVADECLAANQLQSAKLLYEKLHNTRMLAFIAENLEERNIHKPLATP
jgi:hypothetical protein